MGSLVIELQKNSLNQEYPIAGLLRQAYLVATKLKIYEFQTWVNNELNGYAAEESVPEYRKTRGILKAFNPYHGWIEVTMGNNEIEDMITLTATTQSVAEIEKLAASDQSFLGQNFSSQQQLILQDIFKTDFNFMLFVPVTSMFQILNSIRNTILDWSLKLEADGILGEDYSFSEDEKAKAIMSTNIHITNFQGVLGDVSESSLNQNLTQTNTTNNLDELIAILKQHHIAESDINTLKECITLDGQINDKIGPSVANWIGKMIAKAADGSWNIAIGTAGNLLASAISSYYGLNAF